MKKFENDDFLFDRTAEFEKKNWWKITAVL